MYWGEEGPESRLETNEKGSYWITPYAGTLRYTAGKTRKVKAGNAPAPLHVKGTWDVTFPLDREERQKTYDRLASWSEAEEEDFRYFSGTATYRTTIHLPKKWIKNRYALELDLGDVRVMAEVIVNGKNLGTLWKAPFRINIDQAHRAEVTN